MGSNNKLNGCYENGPVLFCKTSLNEKYRWHEERKKTEAEMARVLIQMQYSLESSNWKAATETKSLLQELGLDRRVLLLTMPILILITIIK